MKKIINIGFLGCGRVAQHYKDLILKKKIKYIKVVACCDLNKRKALKLSKQLKCNYYTDYKRMYNENSIDLVLILTESGKHFTHSIEALKNNKNILIEKPITLIPNQAHQINSLAKKKGLIVENVFQNRLNPAVQKLKEAFEKNKFGKIISCSMKLNWHRKQSYYNDGWHGSWSMDGGVINQQAIHHLDALNWICGPIKKVNALSKNIVNKLEAEDTLSALIEFKKGYMGTIEVTTAAKEDFEASISIVGSKGMAKIGGIALNKIELWKFNGKNVNEKLIKRKFSQSVPSGYGLSHITLLNNIIGNFQKNNKKINIPISEAVKAVKLVHSLYSSIEKGKWVLIGDNEMSNKLGKNDKKIN